MGFMLLGAGPGGAGLSAPVNSVAPVVSGVATQSLTLTTTDGTWSGDPTFTYQWQRDDGGYADIEGETDSTYVLTADDVGFTIRCVVTATNAAGSASANSNATAAVVGLPVVSSATIDATGLLLTLVFDRAVEGFTAGAEGFTISPSAGAASLTYDSGDGTDTIVFDISRVIGSAETVTRTYTPGDIADLDGAALAGFADAAVTNDSTADTVPPTVTGMAIDAAGTTLTLTFSENVTGFTAGAEGFTVTASGGAATLSYSSGEGTDSVAMAISRTIYDTETATASYSPGDIVDGSANALAGFSDVAVTNGSTQPPPPPSVRNVSTGTGSLNSTAVTLPTRQSGDTLVAFVAVNGTTTPNANTNWTRRVDAADTSANCRLAVYTRQSDGTDNTPLGGPAADVYGYTVLAVKDVAAGYDTSASGTAGSDGVSVIAPTVTPGGSPSLLVNCYVLRSGSGTITPPGTQTPTAQVNVTTVHRLRCGYETLSNTDATGTRTAGVDASGGRVAASVVVK